MTTKTLAPNFTLQDQDGKSHTLSDYKGQHVLIYFYPMDDTPGCTKEACGIRDLYAEYQKSNIKIFGISPDSPKRHKKFIEKYNLPFTLLSDPKKEVAKKYNASSFFFVKRISYLIDPEGLIEKEYLKVKSSAHAREVLDDFAGLEQRNFCK